MLRTRWLVLGCIVTGLWSGPIDLATAASSPQPVSPPVERYTVGAGDILDINILQPEQLATTATVGPDGSISVPYMGSVYVRGLSPAEIQQEVQEQLADGYLKYPVVAVSLKESRSRKFFVYGEVVRPGGYPFEEHATVLRAISIAEGFTKFGSSSKIKVLRMKKSEPGYEVIPVNIKAVMAGKTQEDVLLQPGDMVVVAEGIF